MTDPAEPPPLEYASPDLRKPSLSTPRLLIAGICLAMGIFFTASGLAISTAPSEPQPCTITMFVFGVASCIVGLRLHRGHGERERSSHRWWLPAYVPPLALSLWAALLPDRTRTGRHDLTFREYVIDAAAYWIGGIAAWYVWRMIRRMMRAADKER